MLVIRWSNNKLTLIGLQVKLYQHIALSTKILTVPRLVVHSFKVWRTQLFCVDLVNFILQYIHQSDLECQFECGLRDTILRVNIY